MNPLLSSFVKQIDGAIDELAEVLAETRETRDRAVEQREELRQQYWSRGREIAVMQNNAEEYEALKAECEALHKERRALREHLGRVLTLSKALTSEFRQ